MANADGAREAAASRAPRVEQPVAVPGTGAAPAPRVELLGVSKHFGGAQALSGASITIERGEVHGLLGENGSGKSTLIKVLAGYHTPEAGHLLVDGQPERLPLPAERLRDLGISFVHQDLGLIDSVTVAENLALREIATRPGIFISWRKVHREATALLARYRLDVGSQSLPSELTPFQRAMVAIIRALEGIGEVKSAGKGLLVLDEAMAFLADHERALLASTARELAAGGTSVLLVSHDLDDALKVCDRITVLRDGRVAGTVDARHTDRAQLAGLILGSPSAGHPPVPAVRQNQATAVSLTGLSGRGIPPISLELGAGEIVGLTGLAGESALAAGGVATIAVNGKSQTVRVGASFPSANPVFTLVSIAKGAANIGIANGSYTSGAQTVRLTSGHSLTLVDTADGVRYTLRLLSAS